MTDKRLCEDYEEATYNSLMVLKKNGIRIICNDKDITDDIGGIRMTECKEYGLKCLKCPYWNKYSNYCTKFRIWSETH